ncbi:MAG: 16S rRNA (guanine(966)-N(2))-methyltransferase RsmD [Pseudomonadota bacterium]|nr:16S rRNA (guanine(966)-N(2))-methyltransferase RsmD [Pseudomonadota bacterium]
MRIIAGKHKGRRIDLGKGAGGAVRPTSDFAREAIFNLLAHGRHGLNGHTFSGKAVLDVFCGSGALGLEALSRGAERVMFIDSAREAIASVRQNAERIREDAVEFLQADARQLLPSRRGYDLIFLDPPYFGGLLAPALKSLHKSGWIAEGALIVAEHDAKEDIKIPEPFSVTDERRYGRAMVKLIIIASDRRERGNPV